MFLVVALKWSHTKSAKLHAPQTTKHTMKAEKTDQAMWLLRPKTDECVRSIDIYD